MTPSELKRLVQEHNPESKFFLPINLRSGGDTIRNYGVRRAVIDLNNGDTNVEVWELYRKKQTPKGFINSAYFDATTFRHRHAKVRTPTFDFPPSYCGA